MRTTHRSYSEVSGDFNLLCRFIVAHNDHVRTYSTWSLGRFVDWKYGLYENKTSVADFCDRNAQLWFDGFSDLAAFAISENGGADFAIVTSPGYRFLFEEMLHWVLAHWSDRGSRPATEITEHQPAERGILERSGLARESIFATQRFDLTAEIEPGSPLETGFVIVDMMTHPDYRAQRVLRAAAFSNQTDLSEAELQRQLAFYNYLHQGPIYHAPTDLCVMADDGQLVAGCEALIDARNVHADIERVCTHPDFRRRGFGRAVIRECLRRLREMGLRNAYITGYSPEAIALYGSLGAADEMQSYIYGMETGDAGRNARH